MAIQDDKVKDILRWSAFGAVIVIIIALCIVFRINEGRAKDIISRYDGYLETVDSLANGCSPLPTNLQGFSEEILGLDNYDSSNVDFVGCKKLADFDKSYFVDLKDTIRQMAIDRYYGETKSSVIFAATDFIQCLVEGCPAAKIKTHYNL